MDPGTALANAEKRLVQLKEYIKNAKDAELTKLAENVPGFPAVSLEPVRTLTGHLGKIFAMHWGGKDNKRLVSASQDGKLIIWNAWAKLKTHAIPLRSTWVMTCAFSRNPGNLVASGGLDNICSIYNLQHSRDGTSQFQPRELLGHTGYISCCRFLNDTKIITSSGDNSCILWDIDMGTQETQYNKHQGDVMSISIHDASTFVSGGCDSLAYLWDIRSGKSTMVFPGHTTDINYVDFFPDGNAFASGSDDNTCRLFDIRAAQELHEYSHPTIKSPVSTVGFSKSGRFLFAGYDDCTCYIWDVLKGTQVGALPQEDKVASLGLSIDGTALCTASWNAKLIIWAPPQSE